ncbi:MAG: hypothetical protein Q605_AUC00026G0002, partial [Actinomyces urogenitalis DORA_12]
TGRAGGALVAGYGGARVSGAFDGAFGSRE